MFQGAVLSKDSPVFSVAEEKILFERKISSFPLKNAAFCDTIKHIYESKRNQTCLANKKYLIPVSSPAEI